MPESVVLHVPAGSRLRPDAPLSQVKLAVAHAVTAQVTDRGKWIELALRTDTEDRIRNHPRLLRSLAWNDDDYPGCVHDVVPALLGWRQVRAPWNRYGPDDPPAADVYLDNLPLLEEYLDLPVWLAEHEPRLHRLLYARDPAEAVALENLTELAATRGLTEISRQLQRLHRDLGDDLSAAVGHAKELVESACKHVLGQTGPGAGAKFPQLVDAALRSVGRHPAQVDPGDPDAQLLKQLLGATAGQLQAIAGLRNRVGTGHGRAGDVVLDQALAQLAIGQALTAVTYLLRVHDEAATAPVGGVDPGAAR